MAENTNKKRLTTFRTCMFAFLCVVMLALGVHFTVAAFTANSFLKAVATTNQSDSLFSSDTLVGYTTAQGDSELNQNRQTLILSAAQDDTASFSFNVRNHLKDNREVVNPKDVFYTLTVEVQGENLSDLSDYGVTVTRSSGDATTSATRDGSTFAFGQRTLQGNFATTDTFTVKFPADDIGKVSFVVKAVASGPGTNLWGLAAKLVSSQAASVESSSVSGNLVLHTGEKSTNDAYNYQITVTGKEATVTLTWPSDKVEIEPFFEKKYGGTLEANSATFTLQPGVTTINFYQLNGRTDVTNNDFTCK